MHPRSSNTRTSSSDRHEVFSTDSAFGPPALLGSLARSHAPTNSKVFELCTRFQLLSQPNGLCSSSRPCVSRSISVFDCDFPVNDITPRARCPNCVAPGAGGRHAGHRPQRIAAHAPACFQELSALPSPTLRERRHRGFARRPSPLRRCLTAALNYGSDEQMFGAG